MKKTVSFLLFVMIIIVSVSTALAVDATYHNGMITVSTGDSGFFEILIDGAGTGRWVGTGMPSNTFSWELPEGDHTVRLYSPDGDAGSSVKIHVGSESPVTPDNPDQSSSEDSTAPDSKDNNTSVSFTAIEATCDKDGLTELGQAVPALGHRYTVKGRNDTTLQLECIRCGKKIQAGLKAAVQNRYGNIILDGSGKVLPYQAAPGKAEEKIMVFTLDKAAEEAVLTLDGSLIMQIIRDGFNQVEVVNGKADVLIDLYQISPSWFNTSEKVDHYIFTIRADAPVTVETLINGEKLAAETFSGVNEK